MAWLTGSGSPAGLSSWARSQMTGQLYFSQSAIEQRNQAVIEEVKEVTEGEISLANALKHVSSV